MNISLPKGASIIISELEKAGFEAFVVGGCVRDVLLGKTPKDWDITTDALPEDIKRIFRVTIDTGIAHGTVTVRINKQNFEVTTYRTDGEYLDGRHPKNVTFVRELKEDLRRRDFTINAIAYNEKVGLVDEFEGVQDLNNNIIRCVENPEKRFSEDALRMLRAVRFSAQLGFEIEKETELAIKKKAKTLSKISVERICDEFIKLICSDRPETVTKMYELGLLSVFFPQWEAMVKTPQNTKHHRGTVAEHTIWVMQGVPASKRLRLAALLHDVGKPICRKQDEKGQDHFAGHPSVGAKMSKDFMRSLKLDNDTINFVTRLIKFHDDRPPMTQKNVRRCINRMGEDLFPDMFELRRADVLGQSEYKSQEKLDEIELFKKYYEEIIKENQCFSAKDLAIGGKDIIALGIDSGPKIGELINLAVEFVIDDPSRNQREILIKYIGEIVEK